MTDAPENDPLYLELVDRLARGKPTPWRLDERYPTEGLPEVRYRGGDRDGDKQALLWEIYLAAEAGEPIPQWAATEFRQIMLRLFRGALPDWEAAFGTTLAKKNKKKGPDSERGVYPRTMQKMARIMVPLWRYAQELRAKGWKVNDKFYEELGRKFDLSGEEAEDFYQPMQRFVKEHCPKYLDEYLKAGGNFRPEMFR
jgi:hypothetical protein